MNLFSSDKKHNTNILKKVLNKKLDGRQKCLRCNSRIYQINLIRQLHKNLITDGNANLKHFVSKEK